MVANAITLFRLILLPISIWFLLAGNVAACLTLFLIAWALDGVDGYVARRLHEESEAGSFFDKFTDRVFIFFLAWGLVAKGVVPWWGIFLITKDIILLPVPVMHSWREQSMIPSGKLGKLVTFLQGISLGWLLLHWPGVEWLVGATALLGLWSGLTHFRAALKLKR